MPATFSERLFWSLRPIDVLLSALVAAEPSCPDLGGGPSHGNRSAKYRPSRLSALVAAAPLLGTVISTWQAIRATKAERLAESELSARLEADGANGRAQAAFLDEQTGREELRR